MATQLHFPKFKAFDASGNFLSGGKLYTYIPGTTTDKATYSDKDLSTPNTNPVILDSKGEATVYLSGEYKLNLLDASDVQQSGFPVDNVSVSGPPYGAATYYPNYNETDQGISGDGATIKSYVDIISADTATIYLAHNSGNATTVYTLTTSTTISSSITLYLEPGAILDGAGTLTLNGNLKAGLTKIFGSSITVTTSGLVPESYPEWWGVDKTGTNDASAMFLSADAMGTSTVKINDGTYRIDSRVDFTDVDVVGSGSSSVTINAYTLTGFAITWNSPSNDKHNIGGFKVVSQGSTQSGVHIKGGTSIKVFDIEVRDFDTTGIQIGEAGLRGVYYSHIDRLYVGNSTTQGTTGILIDGLSAPNTNDNILTNCAVLGKITTMWHIKGNSNTIIGGDASWDASGTGVTDCIKIEGFSNVVNEVYMEASSGTPTRFFNFTSTAYSNRIKDIHLNSIAGSNMSAMITDDGWANRVELLDRGFNFHGYTTSRNQENLIPNSHFRQWDGSAPTGWQVVTGTITQESTTVRGGAYSAKLAASTDNPLLRSYLMGHASAITPYVIADFHGENVKAAVWCKTTVAGSGNLKIYVDGTGGAGFGAQTHTGGGNWELLTAMAKVPTDATYVMIDLRGHQSASTTGDIYYSEPILVKGYQVPIPQPGATHDTYARMMGPFIGSPSIAMAELDATPSVADGNNFTSHATGVTVTALYDGIEGQEINIVSGGATVYDTTANARLVGSSVDITTAAGDITSWLCITGGTTTSVWKLTRFIDISANNSGGI